jgi:hypothetical protein
MIEASGRAPNFVDWCRSVSNLHPHVAYFCRGKTRKTSSDEAACRLGQVEACLTVREDLFPPQPQMACYRASAAVFTGVGMQCEGILC